MEREPLKTVIAVVGTAVTYLLGGFDAVLTALITLTMVDYISGVAAAWYGRRLSSEAGAKGIVKKVGMFVVVSICHVLDQTGGLGEPVLRSIAAWWYIANEAISIMENLSEIGVPIPERVKAALAIWRDGDRKEMGGNA